MKKWVMASVFAVGVALFATASWSDVTSSGASPPPSLPAADPPDQDVDLAPIPYSAMSPAEQAVIDNGRNINTAPSINAGWDSASIQMGLQAAAQAAVQQLGIDNIGQGVVQ